MVMGGDSCFEGRGFRIQAPYTGWTFICCEDYNVCLKRRKLTKNRAGIAILLKRPFLQ